MIKTLKFSIALIALLLISCAGDISNQSSFESSSSNTSSVVFDKYTLTFESNGGSVIAPITINYGESLNLPKPSKIGHRFDWWFTDVGLTQEFTLTTMPASNLKLYAKWNVDIGTEIRNPNTNIKREFGRSVAIENNDYLIVGSSDIYSYGAIYVYKISDPSYIRIISAPLSCTLCSGNDFGYSFSSSFDWLVVGAPSDGPFSSGSVYVYKLSDEFYERKITPSNASDNDRFGESVEIVLLDIFIGAPGRNYGSGAVYVFNVLDLSYGRMFTAWDSSAEGFGHSLSFGFGFLIVGAPFSNNSSGAVYVYEFGYLPFNEIEINGLKKLFFSDGGNYFGKSVSIGSDFLVVGAPFENDYRGAVYIFDTIDFNFIAKLTAPSGFNGDSFGHCVSSASDFLAVGAPFENDSHGAVYIFDTIDFNFIAKLTAPSGFSGDSFGYSVYINDWEKIIVGSPFRDNGLGSVYLFYP